MESGEVEARNAARLCRACREPIPTDAKLCNVCKTYQNCLRAAWPHVGALIALLAFIANYGPQAMTRWGELFGHARFDMRVVQWGDSGTKLLVTNVGWRTDTPLTVIAAPLNEEPGAHLQELFFSDTAPVPPGSSTWLIAPGPSRDREGKIFSVYDNDQPIRPNDAHRCVVHVKGATSYATTTAWCASLEQGQQYHPRPFSIPLS